MGALIPAGLDPGIVVVAVGPVARLLVAVLHFIAQDGVSVQAHVGSGAAGTGTYTTVLTHHVPPALCATACSNHISNGVS